MYLGVVPVVRTAGGLQWEGEGEVVEWGVKMQRLPDEATVAERLRRGQVSTQLVESLARKVPSFHRAAETNDWIASFGRFEAVEHIVLDVFARPARDGDHGQPGRIRQS